MTNQHPSIVRAAALQSRFWAHAPQPELCAAIQAEIELLDAQESDREYLDQAETVASFTVTTQPHPSHGARGTITIRNFTTRAQAQTYADYYGRSTITETEIVLCTECGGHGSDGPIRIHWTNPNNMAMRCGRCNGSGEEPVFEEFDEDDYPDIDPYRD